MIIKPFKNLLTVKPQDLMSDEYRKIIEEYHETAGWRKNTCGKRVPFIKEIVEKYNTENILDYGAGNDTLNRVVNFKITSYDLGIPEFAEMPEPHDIVVSFGVLEHVEPEYIDNVLLHVRLLTKIVAYLDIGTISAKHILPDGRNAHLIVENKDWWIKKLKQAGFKIISAVSNFKEGTPNTKLNRNQGKGCVMFVCEPI